MKKYNIYNPLIKIKIINIYIILKKIKNKDEIISINIEEKYNTLYHDKLDKHPFEQFQSNERKKLQLLSRIIQFVSSKKGTKSIVIAYTIILHL